MRDVFEMVQMAIFVDFWDRGRNATFYDSIDYHDQLSSGYITIRINYLTFLSNKNPR